MTRVDDPLSRFATIPDVRIEELRHSSVRLAVAQLVDGEPSAALMVMLLGVEQQARVAGIRCKLT